MRYYTIKYLTSNKKICQKIPSIWLFLEIIWDLLVFQEKIITIKEEFQLEVVWKRLASANKIWNKWSWIKANATHFLLIYIVRPH